MVSNPAVQLLRCANSSGNRPSARPYISAITDILHLNGRLVHRAIFQLSNGENPTVDGWGTTALACSPWEDYKWPCFEDKSADLEALTWFCSEQPVPIHAGNGGRSNKTGFVAPWRRIVVLLGFQNQRNPVWRPICVRWNARTEGFRAVDALYYVTFVRVRLRDM